jgi:hypothetical protein
VRRTIAALAAISTIALCATTALAAGPTGDPAAIAFYRHAVRATNALPAYVQSQSGYVRIDDSLGPKRFAHWAWGWDQFQPGYVAANERLVLAQRGGHTVWIDDTLTASTKGCSSPRCRQAVPIELVITKAAAYDGLISSGTHASCFVRESLRNVPYAVGSPWWATVGEFSKVQPDGSLSEVTSRFSAGGQLVTETDWISNGSNLFARSVLRLAAGTGRPAYGYRNTDAQVASSPKLPALTLCS